MVIFIFIGIILIVINITSSNKMCPKSQIIYKYLPRTFDQEQDDPIYVSDVFADMFSQSSVWVKGVNSIDARKQEKINKYFISQY